MKKMNDTSPRALLRAMFDAAVGAVQAGHCVPPHLPEPDLLTSSTSNHGARCRGRPPPHLLLVAALELSHRRWPRRQPGGRALLLVAALELSRRALAAEAAGEARA